MKRSADETPPAEEGEEGWDETVLVWNATVARIPPPAVERNSARDVGGAEGAEAARRRGRLRSVGGHADRLAGLDTD